MAPNGPDGAGVTGSPNYPFASREEERYTPAGTVVPDDPDVRLLVEGASRLGIVLDSVQQARFVRYRAELLTWNQNVNLTAITAPAAVMTRHFLDSLTAVVALAPETRALPLRVMDVGSGAGLPGLALALAFPHWHVTLVDSVGKKTAFLRHVCSVIGVEDRVRVVTARAEDAGRDPAHREGYDIAVARAVARVSSLAEYLLPLCTVGGTMIVLKKGDVEAEVAVAAHAVFLLGGGPLQRIAVPEMADLGSDRVVLVATKQQATPAHYPRRAGLPVKQPLS